MRWEERREKRRSLTRQGPSATPWAARCSRFDPADHLMFGPLPINSCKRRLFNTFASSCELENDLSVRDRWLEFVVLPDTFTGQSDVHKTRLRVLSKFSYSSIETMNWDKAEGVASCLYLLCISRLPVLSRSISSCRIQECKHNPKERSEIYPPAEREWRDYSPWRPARCDRGCNSVNDRCTSNTRTSSPSKEIFPLLLLLSYLSMREFLQHVRWQGQRTTETTFECCLMEKIVQFYIDRKDREWERERERKRRTDGVRAIVNRFDGRVPSDFSRRSLREVWTSDNRRWEREIGLLEH